MGFNLSLFFFTFAGNCFSNNFTIAMKIKNNLTSEQGLELIRVLNNRFKKTNNVIRNWNGLILSKNWHRMLKNSGRSVKWKHQAVSRM